MTGEVTAVLRTLPTQTSRVVPFRLRHRALALLLLLLAAAAAIGVLVWVSSRAHRGNGQLPIKPPQRYPQQVIPCGTCARASTRSALRPTRRPTPTWPSTNRPGPLGHPAVLRPPSEQGGNRDLRQLRHRLPPGARRPAICSIIDVTPGFTATIYARHDAPADALAGPGWIEGLVADRGRAGTPRSR